jgi:hypothetical protein
MKKGSQVLRFLRLMPKGEKELSPKQKDRTTISKFSQKLISTSIWSLSQLVFESASKWVFKWYLISNWYVKVKFQLIYHLVFQNCFSNWYLQKLHINMKKFQLVQFHLVSISKPSWKLRGEFLQGELLFCQRKSIWNRERNFKS